MSSNKINSYGFCRSVLNEVAARLRIWRCTRRFLLEDRTLLILRTHIVRSWSVRKFWIGKDLFCEATVLFPYVAFVCSNGFIWIIQLHCSDFVIHFFSQIDIVWIKYNRLNIINFQIYNTFYNIVLLLNNYNTTCYHVYLCTETK